MEGRGGGHPGGRSGVRDTLAPVWSRLMETTVACSPPPPLPPPFSFQVEERGWEGRGGVMDAYTEEEEEGDEGEIQEDAVPVPGRRAKTLRLRR